MYIYKYIIMNSNNTSEQIYTTTVNIRSNKVVGDINKILLNHLKTHNEGKCNNDGFILLDSIKIIDRSIGEIKTINNNSYITYRLKYSTKILNISKNDKLECYINSITKMGLISYIKLTPESTIKNSPFIIITPKEFLPDGKDIAEYNSNDKINVIVTAYRIKFKSTNIQIISKIE